MHNPTRTDNGFVQPMASEDPRIAAALERNGRYVLEFVEAFDLCPYAKRTRETGRLHRTVLLDKGGAPGTPDFLAVATLLDRAFEQFELLPADSIEVGLVILPCLEATLSRGVEGAHAFEALVSAARARMQSRHAGGDAPFYCVPFHPDFAEDLADAHRAVRFIRRSPDPTVQLVRGSVLRAVRGSGGTDYVDVSGMSAAELLAVTAPPSASERIAAANLDAIRAHTPERIRQLLAGFRK